MHNVDQVDDFDHALDPLGQDLDHLLQIEARQPTAEDQHAPFKLAGDRSEITVRTSRNWRTTPSTTGWLISSSEVAFERDDSRKAITNRSPVGGLTRPISRRAGLISITRANGLFGMAKIVRPRYFSVNRDIGKRRRPRGTISRARTLGASRAFPAQLSGRARQSRVSFLPMSSDLASASAIKVSLGAKRRFRPAFHQKALRARYPRCQPGSRLREALVAKSVRRRSFTISSSCCANCVAHNCVRA